MHMNTPHENAAGLRHGRGKQVTRDQSTKKGPRTTDYPATSHLPAARRFHNLVDPRPRTRTDGKILLFNTPRVAIVHWGRRKQAQTGSQTGRKRDRHTPHRLLPSTFSPLPPPPPPPSSPQNTHTKLKVVRIFINTQFLLHGFLLLLPSPSCRPYHHHLHSPILPPP